MYNDLFIYVMIVYVYVKIVLKLPVGITLTEKITDSLTGTAP
jgi:hypothetical protein